MEFETKKIDTNILDTLGVPYLEIPEGFIHYQFAERNSGPLIILIHGLSVASFIWEPTFSFLKDRGFRVLRYDLFGRGYSDRPDVHYNQEIFYNQLIGLLKQLELENDQLTIVGQSLGGIIAANYCLENSHQIKQLVLIDPAGLPTNHPAFPRILKVPFINKFIFKRIGVRRIIHDALDAFYNPSRFPNYIDLFQEQIHYEGYSNALLSTLLNMPLQSMASEYEQLGVLDIPVLLLWGANDTVIPSSHTEEFKRLIPHIECHQIPESGHFPHYENPDYVHPILQRFLQKT